MRQGTCVRKTVLPFNGVGDVTVSHTVNLRDYYSGGSLWVHPGVVINILPILNASDTSTTILTPKGRVVPITVYSYFHLVGVDGGWSNSQFILIFSVDTEGVRNSYQEFIDPPISVSNKT